MHPVPNQLRNTEISETVKVRSLLGLPATPPKTAKKMAINGPDHGHGEITEPLLLRERE